MRLSNAGLSDSASVISLNDLMSWKKDTLWLEAIGGNLTQLTKDGIDMLIFAGAICGFDNYESVWRCWNTEPTDEQRKAAKWNNA